jgi:hypothetical protein
MRAILRIWVVVVIFASISAQVAHGQQSLAPTAVTIAPSAALANRLQQAGVEHEIAAWKHDEEVYQWQLWSSKVIFWVVNLIVFSGIVFSAIQFGFGLARRERQQVEEAGLSLKGLKVKSHFLGVVTLAISLAFFYLYLKTVYPITDNNAPDARPASTGQK